MKEPIILSLKEEIKREAQQIEKEIAEHPELGGITVTEEAENALFAKIRAYEEELAEEEAARREVEEIWRKRSAEFSEELVPENVDTGDTSEEKGLSGAIAFGSTGTGGTGETVGENGGVFDTNVENTREKEGNAAKYSGTDTVCVSAGSENNAGAASAEKILHYRKKRKKYVYIAVAAVLVLVMGLGMTSIGSKSYLKVLWERIHGGETMNVINVEDMDEKISEDGDEVTAYRKIDEELGVTAVRIYYRPQKMHLINVQIDKDLVQARMFYDYNGEIIRYTLYLNDDDSSWGEKQEDVKADEYIVTVNNNSLEILVEEFEVPEKENYRQEADFEYKGVHYQLKGVMEKDEFTKVLEGLYFSTKNQ